MWAVVPLAGLRDGVDYVRTSVDGVEDVFVDADRVWQALGYTSSSRTRKAASLIEEAIREAFKRSVEEEARVTFDLQQGPDGVAQAKAVGYSAGKVVGWSAAVNELQVIVSVVDPDLRAVRLRGLLSSAVSERPPGVSVHDVRHLFKDHSLEKPMLLLQSAVADGSEEGPDADDLSLTELQRLVPVRERPACGSMELAAVARDLHGYLGAGRAFTEWFYDQVARCDLVEGRDYSEEVLPEKLKNPKGGRPTRDYVLLLPTAEQVGAVAKGPRGRALRLYFIDCRNRWLAGEAPPSASFVGSCAVPPAPAEPLAVEPASAVRPRHQGFMDQALVPLTLGYFIGTKGIAEHVARRMAESRERDLAQRLVSGELAGLCTLDPGTDRLVFDREALDAWWEVSEPVIIKSVLGGSYALARE